jgi:hypothetical protein
MRTAKEVVAHMTDAVRGYSVEDYLGSRLEVGSRIAPTYNADTGMKWPGGYVVEITDPDGDVDDEGRSIAINPRITVLFDDGDQDSFTTWLKVYGYQYHDPAVFQTDELRRG